MADRWRALRQLLATAHSEQRPVTAGQLCTSGYSLDELNDAVSDGEITLLCSGDRPSNYVVLSSTVNKNLYEKVVSATHIPREAPEYSRFAGLCYWRSSHNSLVLPFAVQLVRPRSSRIIQTTQEDHPAILRPLIFTRDFVYTGDSEFQHAVRDAYDMNRQALDGVFMDPPPWRHPVDELPLALRKP
jgi:hypothetical protein